MKLATGMAISAIMITMLLADMAQAQTTAAEKAAIAEAKAKSNGHDLSVKIKTKKQSNNPDMKEAVTTTTTEVSTPKPAVAQGAPDMPVLDDAQYQPVTDAESSLVYLTGGVGEAETAYFKAIKTGYSLKLAIADKSGAFISEATVTISSMTGEKIASLSDVGPYLLVKLPAGKYTLTISANGVDVGQPVTIRDGKLTALDIRL